LYTKDEGKKEIDSPDIAVGVGGEPVEFDELDCEEKKGSRPKTSGSRQILQGIKEGDKASECDENTKRRYKGWLAE